MSRIIAMLVVCACAERTSSFGNSAPDGGNPAGDAGDGTVASAADDGGSAALADAGAQAAGVADSDGGTADIPSTEKLIDRYGQYVYAISPDGRSVLFARHSLAFASNPTGFVPGTGDLSISTDGGAPKQIIGEGAWYAEFSSDGSGIVIRGMPHGLTLARSDGTVTRQLPSQDDFTLNKTWLSYTSAQDGQFEATRILLPDGDPEVVAKSAAASLGNIVEKAPDGSLVVICQMLTYPHYTCSFFAAGTKTPIVSANPDIFWDFSPDSRWALNGCDLYDRNGFVRSLCESTVFGNPRFSDDSASVAIYDGSAIVVADLTTMATTRLPPLSGVTPWSFTPDGTRLIGRRTTTDVYVAPTSGGDWIALSQDVYTQRGLADFPTGVAVSPDSRIVATTSLSEGVVESIDGAPVHVVSRDGNRAYFATPVFEPAGGHGKAIFYESGYPEYRLAIANADGSGKWIELPPAPGYPRWIGQSVLSWVARGTDPTIRIFGQDATVYDVLVTTDDGTLTGAPLVSGIIPAFADPSIQHPALYFVRRGLGLFRVPVPQPSP